MNNEEKKTETTVTPAAETQSNGQPPADESVQNTIAQPEVQQESVTEQSETDKAVKKPSSKKKSVKKAERKKPARKAAKRAPRRKPIKKITIKKVLDKQGRTQQWLIKQLSEMGYDKKIDAPQMSRYVNGKTAPRDAELLIAIAKILGVPSKFLF